MSLKRLSKAIYTPELLIPGRKPVGPVRVDSTHWAGKHLVGGSLLIKDGREIVTNTIPANINDLPFLPGQRGIECTSSSKYLDYGALDLIEGLPEYFLLTGVNLKGWLSYRGIICFAPSNSYELHMRSFASSGEYQVRTKIGGGLINPTVSGGPTTGDHDLWSYYDGANCYVGYDDTSGSGVTASGVLDGLDGKAFTVGSDSYQPTSRHFTGDVYYWLLFKKSFTEAQRNALRSDPYQFLIPANAAPFLFSAAAPAADDLLLLEYSKLRGGLQTLSGGLM